MYIVYILQSEKDNGYCIGCTNNLERRIQEHNRGLTPSLKKRIPLKVVYQESFENRSPAYKREKQIKNYKGGVAFKKLLAINS